MDYVIKNTLLTIFNYYLLGVAIVTTLVVTIEILDKKSGLSKKFDAKLAIFTCLSSWLFILYLIINSRSNKKS